MFENKIITCRNEDELGELLDLFGYKTDVMINPNGFHMLKALDASKTEKYKNFKLDDLFPVHVYGIHSGTNPTYEIGEKIVDVIRRDQIISEFIDFRDLVKILEVNKSHTHVINLENVNYISGNELTYMIVLYFTGNLKKTIRCNSKKEYDSVFESFASWKIKTLTLQK